MKAAIKVKTGQVWIDKQTGKETVIGNKATGNRHWNTVKVGARKTHHLHEETLFKFYTLKGKS